MLHTALGSLLRFLDLCRNPRPVLWVGTGASAAAGRPTLAQLEAKLLPTSTSTGFAALDEYVALHGPTAFENAVETHLGAPRPFVAPHDSIARLAGANLLAADFTSNYDELLERALEARGVRYVPQVLQQNYALQARAELTPCSPRPTSSPLLSPRTPTLASCCRGWPTSPRRRPMGSIARRELEPAARRPNASILEAPSASACSRSCFPCTGARPRSSFQRNCLVGSLQLHPADH